MIEWALARLWMSWGIRPAAMIGHSIGELVAAAIAGVFSLEDALTAVAVRGRLMQSAPPGAMLAAQLSEQEALPFAVGRLSLAAVNGPRQCVLSGPVEAIDELERKLRATGIRCRKLLTSKGFHSAAMEGAAAEFEERMRGSRARPRKSLLFQTFPGIGSNRRKRPVRAIGRSRCVKRCVFSDGFRALSGTFTSFFGLECGPGRVLSGLTGSMGGDDPESVLGALGRLWAAGAKVDWAGFQAHERRQRVSLPGYPFERQRFWIDAPKAAPAVEIKPEPWYYKPVWKRSKTLRAATPLAGISLIYLDALGLGAEIVSALRASGGEVVTLHPGEQPKPDLTPRRIFILNPGFDQLLSLAQGLKGEVDLCLISNGLQSVNGEPARHLEQALLLGPAKVIPKEFPNIRCQCIDVAAGTRANCPELRARLSRK